MYIVEYFKGNEVCKASTFLYFNFISVGTGSIIDTHLYIAGNKK